MKEINRKIVLCFSSYSCTGKTETVNLINEQYRGFYTVAFDKQKWLLSGYERTRDNALIKEIVLDLFEDVCKRNLPIILMSPMTTEETYLRHKKIAEDNGYEMYFISLTAPRDVLIQRFRERVESAKLKESKTIAQTDEGIFLETLDRGFYTSPDTLVIDTSTNTPEEVVAQLLKRANIE
jgi:RNase adaptor protein for sRNA GlmZ degradation